MYLPAYNIPIYISRRGDADIKREQNVGQKRREIEREQFEPS